MKKWWVKLLLAFVVLLLVLSIWFIGSGTQSRDVVEHYRKQLLAAGEKLDIETFIPSRTDSDKNGAALFDKACWTIAPRGVSLTSTNPPMAMELVAPAKGKVAWKQDEIVSVKYNHPLSNTWAELEWDLANQGAALDLLQQAAAYREIDFGADYREISVPLPQLSKLRQAATLLLAKVIFDLHRGDTASAVTNIQALLTVANAGKNESFIASQSMRSYLLLATLATQWELLQATNLTDEQLATLQTNWQDVELAKPVEKAFLMARAQVAVTMREARAGDPRLASGGGSSGFSGSGLDAFRQFVQETRLRAGDAFWRESWCYEDELKMLETYSVMIQTMRQAETNGCFKDAIAEREQQIVALGLNQTNANWLRKGLSGHYWDFSPQSVRSFANQMDRMISVEAFRKCTLAAIALKRFELRHGTLPKELSALVPEFLSQIPSDPVDGHPLRYRLNTNGTFLLYSIGADGTDNGGDATPVPPLASTLSVWQWQTRRDWVWPQPATPAEVQFYYDHPPK